jgi:parvulin-like peptidyl-prolyl isomerase
VETAREHSDSLPPEQRGNLLGPVRADRITTDRAALLGSLDEMETTGPVRTKRGYMIIRLEKKLPATYPDVEEVSSTLIARKLIPRFMRSAVAARHTGELKKKYPVTLHRDRYSSAPEDAETVIAESPFRKIRNKDVPAKRFFVLDVGETKEIDLSVRQIMLRAMFSELAKKDNLQADPLYARSLELLKQMQLTENLVRRQKTQPDMPLFKDVGTSFTACQQRVLEASGFRLSD